MGTSLEDMRIATFKAMAPQGWGQRDLLGLLVSPVVVQIVYCKCCYLLQKIYRNDTIYFLFN